MIIKHVKRLVILYEYITWHNTRTKLLNQNQMNNCQYIGIRNHVYIYIIRWRIISGALGRTSRTENVQKRINRKYQKSIVVRHQETKEINHGDILMLFVITAWTPASWCLAGSTNMEPTYIKEWKVAKNFQPLEHIWAVVKLHE